MVRSLSTFQFEWWTVEVREATGKITWEVKSKSKDGAIKQIKKWADEHTRDVQTGHIGGFTVAPRPDFETEVFWETLTLDRKGYQRRF